MTEKRAMHYVCTIDEARNLVEGRNDFRVSDCGCRVEKGDCARSHANMCLSFNEQDTSGGQNIHKIDLAEVKKLIDYAVEKKLVARPFRDFKTLTFTTGICFCCDDCCGYFLNEDEYCDKGEYIQNTHMEECTNCGFCVDACYFGAREMKEGTLSIIEENCYGCGLCVQVCPVDCIEMVKRESN